MPVYVWIALALALASLLAGPVTAAVRGLRTLRVFKSLAGQASTGLDEISRKMEVTEQRTLVAAAGAEQLSAAVAHLELSVAELQVLKAATDETRAGIKTLTDLRPRK